MSLVNFQKKVANCKIVYFGPCSSGKMSNLHYIRSKTGHEINKKQNHSYFDVLPLSLGKFRGFTTRFHLYTLPSETFYHATRKLILSAVDGVVFVMDSQLEKMEANLESMETFKIYLGEQGYDINKIPMVIQYNKQDLPNAADIEYLRKLFNKRNVPDFAAIAVMGQGVFDTLKSISKIVLKELKS